MTSRMQLRGNCQCCGRDQAVQRERVAKHGYEVTDGYFRGVCSGHQFDPLQVKRDIADQIVKTCRDDAVHLDAEVVALKDGSKKPKFVQGLYSVQLRGYEQIPFERGDKYEQVRAIESEIFATDNRARAARSFADGLERLANEKHGQPLREVMLTAPEQINYGEQRQHVKGVLKCVSVFRGSVVYEKTASDGKTYRGKLGVQAWRKLPIAQKVA